MSWKSVALIAGVLTLSTSAYAAENLFAGTWKANEAKSHITNTAQQNQVQLIVIAPYGDDGWTRVQIDVREPLKSGREEHFSAKFDGKPYQTNGGDPRQIALTRIDARTLEQVTIRNGKESSRSRITVSADGKTMTNTGSGANGRGVPYTDNVVVYDRVQ
jgi:hypothetical protein